MNFSKIQALFITIKTFFFLTCNSCVYELDKIPFLVLCDPMDCSLLSSSVHGIF